MKSLEVKDLVIGYEAGKGFCSLTEPFSFSLELGHLVAILGANGTGKSTLIKTLTDQTFSKGQILLFGQPIKSFNSKQLAENLSVLNTHFDVQAFTTVAEVIEKGRSHHTNWLSQMTFVDKNAVQFAAQKVGVTHLMEREFVTLSDGEKQRTLLAMALSQASSLIVLDEPTAYVDYPNKYIIAHLLKEIASVENKTVLFSTHDIEVALTYADDFIYISHGEVMHLTKSQLLEDKMLIRLFEHHDMSNELQNRLINHLQTFK